MTEQTTNTDPVEETTAEATSATTQIMDELGKAGVKLTAAFQTAWQSDERIKAEEELRKALKIAGERIDVVAEDVRKHEVTADLMQQASRAGEAVQQNEMTQQVKQGLLTGLRRINSEIERGAGAVRQPAERGRRRQGCCDSRRSGCAKGCRHGSGRRRDHCQGLAWRASKSASNLSFPRRRNLRSREAWIPASAGVTVTGTCCETSVVSKPNRCGRMAARSVSCLPTGSLSF